MIKRIEIRLTLEYDTDKVSTPRDAVASALDLVANPNMHSIENGTQLTFARFRHGSDVLDFGEPVITK